MKKLIAFLILFCNFTLLFADGSTYQWHAKWISANENIAYYDTTTPAPFFRKVLKIDNDIETAILKVTGLGYFEFYLNGKKIGDQVLAPAVSRYDKRVYFLEFDVTKELRQGTNVAGCILGNGFYNVDTHSAWKFAEAPWRSQPSFICELNITYKNGSTSSIISDNTWKVQTGPILFDQLRNGETYDANKELKEWLNPEFDDSKWQNSHIVTGPEGALVKENMPPIKKTKTLLPQKIIKTDKGYTIDFGQNIAGWAKIKISEPKGQKVTIRYGERLFEDGTIDQQELSRFIFTGETQTTHYISNGKANQFYEPRFTYFGFQYIQVEGATKPINKADIEAYMINTAFDTIGYFECSNPLINQIHQNIQWSFLGNYHSFPEDCPHREKMGWTGDAHLVSETALFNYNVKSAYRKWLLDFKDEQQQNGDLPGIIPTSGWGYDFKKDSLGYGPQWEGAAIIIPWQVYRFTGDTIILEEFYPLMKKYVLFLESVSEDYLLAFGIDDHKSIKTHTKPAYLSSAFFHELTSTMAEISKILSLKDDQHYYNKLSERIFNSFQNKYFDKDRVIYGNGGQTSMALALSCGLVPEKHKEKIINSLIHNIKNNDYHFDAGVVGVKNIIEVLLDNNRKDVLYKMVNQKDFPSFGYWIESGANTMWQNWDGSQSRNHIMFGSIGDYFYKGLAGINPVVESPGFKKININPQFPEDMDYLKCKHKSKYGWIEIDWSKKGNIISLNVLIPENTESFLNLPFHSSQISTSNNLYNSDKGNTIYPLLSGKHTFKIYALK